MRSNQNPSGSATRSVGERSVGASAVAQPDVERPNVDRQSMVAKLSMPQMPVEWLDSGSWRLPSGKALAEFALQAGFLAPLLFRADGFRKNALNESPGISGNTAQARGKQLGKGEGR
jgi:hypothetical protein